MSFGCHTVAFFEPVDIGTETIDEDIDASIFMELVPVQDGATSIVIRNPQGNDLASIILDGISPTLNITFPGAGETLR